MVLDQIYSAVKTVKAEKQTKSKAESKAEKPLRSLVKAISWRAFGTLDTVLLSWLIVGDWTVAISIGSFELLTKTILYYFHERMWTKIKWGK